MRRPLVLIHWIHAGFLLLLLLTGVLLYFSGIPLLPKRAIRNVHLVIAGGYALFLLYSLYPVGKYFKRLGKQNLKRLHIAFIYFFAFVWSVTGYVLWQNQPWLLQYRVQSLFIHDLMSIVIVPWIALHVCWKVLKRRTANVKFIQKIGNVMTRREFLHATVGSLLFLLFGSALKWFKPGLTEDDTRFRAPVRKGYFRIFKVTDEIPSFDENTWKLTIDGLVERPGSYDIKDLEQFKTKKIVRDFHCVTGWSVLGVEWEGIPFNQFVQAVNPKPEGKYVKMVSSDKRYTETFKLEQLMSQDVILAFRMDGKLLLASQGLPCRLLHPDMYGYKSIKWVERIEFTNVREKGYWEALENYDLDGYIT